MARSSGATTTTTSTTTTSAARSGLGGGDSVDYWFSGGGESTDPVTFEVVEDADADVLIVAAEDRTGVSQIPNYASTTDPNYLSYYADAVTASGRTFDVYDTDANGRTSPDHLGVLGHYDTVVWYTGNDLVTREPGWRAGMCPDWRWMAPSTCASTSTRAAPCSTGGSVGRGGWRNLASSSSTTWSPTSSA